MCKAAVYRIRRARQGFTRRKTVLSFPALQRFETRLPLQCNFAANRCAIARARESRTLPRMQFPGQLPEFERHKSAEISFGINGFRSTEFPAPSRAWAGHAFRHALRIPLRSTGAT